jgi:hypothetical protein
VGRVSGIVAGLVMCALPVSACSSGSPAPQKATTAHVTTKAATAHVTTQTVRIGRYTQVFDTPLPVDPAQASVVEGFRAAIVLWDKSQEELTLVPPVTAYVTGRALSNLKASLVTMQDDKVVPGGADRFFKTIAAIASGASATITTCDDSSKLEEVNPGTGVADPALDAPANQQYLFETWQMTKIGGQWAVSAVSPVTLPDSRAEPCQP